MRRTHAVFAGLLAGSLAGSLAPAPPARADDPPPAGDEEPEGDGGGGAPPPAPAGGVPDEELRPKLEALLRLRPCELSGGVVTLDYPLAAIEEVRDFEAQGYDKVDLREVKGQRTTDVGLELGAGSAAVGRLRHKLTLTDDFEVEAEWWMAYNSPSAFVCIGLNDKVGVLWGQQVVKLPSLRPWAKGQPAADPTLFREERAVRTVIKATNGLELTVETNAGGRSAQVRFTKGELRQVRVSILARNCRAVVTSLRIRGKVDPSKLD